MNEIQVDSETVLNEQAYMLFYRLRPPSKVKIPSYKIGPSEIRQNSSDDDEEVKVARPRRPKSLGEPDSEFESEELSNDGFKMPDTKKLKDFEHTEKEIIAGLEK